MYLYVKTVERAHTPKKLWQKIRLSAPSEVCTAFPYRGCGITDCPSLASLLIKHGQRAQNVPYSPCAVVHAPSSQLTDQRTLHYWSLIECRLLPMPYQYLCSSIARLLPPYTELQREQYRQQVQRTH